MAGSLTAGVIFAGYRIERVLGTGGMGTVYLARHPRLPRYDALKVLPKPFGSDPEYQARFLREAETAARIDHPNVVAVHDRGVADGRPWIAMQYVEGIDAAELVRRHPDGLPPELALRVTAEVANGLDEVHRGGLLHRDVKPANILLRQGGDDRALVTDFGIAKAAGESTALTQTGAVLATLAYAAPEQLMGRAIDHRADVYALGCAFFELLTGQQPFPRTNTAAVMHAHIAAEPPRPSLMNPALPQAIDTVIARVLAKDPADRYDSCGGFAEAAAAGLRGVPDRHRPAARARARRRRGYAIGALLAVMGLIWSGVLVLQRDPESGTAVAPPSATAGTTTSATPAGSAPSWGNFAFVAEAFPKLLPATPTGSGYQGIRCKPLNEDVEVADVNSQPGRIATLDCQGNDNPAQGVSAYCNSDRVPGRVRALTRPDWTQGGEETWERAGRRGRIIWGQASTGKFGGTLQIQFDDAARNFCEVIVWGAAGTTGADLMQRWWPNAPL